MIKASELRTGNFARISIDNSIISIEEIYEKSIMYYIDNYTDVIELENIEPIPLTKEWLLKLGFVKDENADDEWYNNQYHPLLILTINPDIKTVMVESALSTIDQIMISENIQYVHQLQNLYFALTGEELTISE